MPEFTNPFVGVTPGRKLTFGELTRAIRLNIAAEYEAVHIYEAHAEATDNPLAKKVLREVADEERVHAGEFQTLLNILLDDEQRLFDEGREEVEEALAELRGEEGSEEDDGEEGDIPSVGNMKE